MPPVSSADRRAAIQEAEYAFPYHYLPRCDPAGGFSAFRFLDWGLDYLCVVRHLAERITALAPESLLDVGCGDGRLIHELTGKVPRLVGIDLSARSLAFARGFNPGALFHRGDPDELDEVFPVVTAVEVLEHVPDQQLTAFLKKLRRRLAPGGVLLLSVPTVNLPLTAKHHRHYTLELLEEQVAASGVDLRRDGVEYLMRKSFLLHLYARLTMNRLWRLEVPALARFVWRYTWQRLRVADPATGGRLLVTYRDPR